VTINTDATAAWYADHIEMEMREDDYGLHRFFPGGSFHSPPTTDIRTVMDIGANVGFFSLTIAQLFSNAIIHAFELEPHNYRRLIWNICQNGYQDRIIAHNVGLSGRPGFIPFLYHSQNPGGSLEINPGDPRAMYLPVVPLRDSFKIMGLEKVDFFKLDCEGCEYSTMLEFSPSYLTSIISYVAGELHPTQGDYNAISYLLRSAFPDQMQWFSTPSASARPLVPPRG